MLQQIRIEKWLLEIDPIKTREFYSKDMDVCNCLYCLNYVESTKLLKTPISDIFNELGILPEKPAHLSDFPSEEVGTRIYMGDYHFVGRVLEGELCTVSNFNEMNTIQVENFTLGFTEELVFVPEEFPSPVLQLSFESNMPWVLKENQED